MSIRPWIARLAPRLGMAVLATAMAVSLWGPQMVGASDHDDGETNIKSRNSSLTDVYVFREGDQSGNVADNSNLIMIMNTNPRSVPRQQYYFNNNARYEFNVSRLASATATPTGSPDVVLRFEFGQPNANNQQNITISAIKDGQSANTGGQTFFTTPLGAGGAPAAAVNNTVSLFGQNLTVFAGLREDPFFFDVQQYFRIRGGAAGAWNNPGFDFAAGYNVNAIAVRVPISFLAGDTGVTTFDVWATISIPSTTAAQQ